MTNEENYIKSLRQILIKTKWPQSRLAQELGVTFATVNRWLNEHTRPHPVQIHQIEQLFKNIVGILPVTAKEINSIIQQVMMEKKKRPNIFRLLQQEAIRENFLLELTYHSDAIEGSTLTKKETEAILFDKATIKDKSLMEHLEASNHAAVLKEIFDQKITLPISEALIKNLHKMLMQGIREDAGEYSRYQRGIRGVDLILPAPEDIPEEMKGFVREVNRAQANIISHVAKTHADFEAIHPFGDGNGRVGRLMIMIQLLNHGLAPCVITLENKVRYYESLEYAQKKSPSHLILFLGKAILKGYDIIERYRK